MLPPVLRIAIYARWIFLRSDNRCMHKKTPPEALGRNKGLPEME